MVEKETKQEVKEEPKQEYNLVEVPTGKALAIETKDGDLWDMNYAVVYLLNEVAKLKRTVG